MIPQVSSLFLLNGQTLESGSEWPDDPNFVVGPIYFIPESTVTFRDDEGDGGATTDTTPACYEAWQVPADFLVALYSGKFEEMKETLEQIPVLRCIRVWISSGLPAQESWPSTQAWFMIVDRFKDQLTEAGVIKEEELNGSPAQQQANA